MLFSEKEIIIAVVSLIVGIMIGYITAQVVNKKGSRIESVLSIGGWIVLFCLMVYLALAGKEIPLIVQILLFGLSGNVVGLNIGEFMKGSQKLQEAKNLFTSNSNEKK